MEARASTAGPPPSDVVVRAPNHLGDVVMALPALVESGADVMVVHGLAPVLEMAAVPGKVLPLERGPAGFVDAVRLLRRRRYRSGVLLTPAFSAAWLFRCGGVRRLRGTLTDARGWLLSDRVDPAWLRGRHRVAGFRLLLGGAPERSRAAPSVVPPSDRVAAWRARLSAPTPDSDANDDRHPTVPPPRLLGLVPGANAPARRWPPERFAELARAMSGREARVVVLGGGAERMLTARVASGVPDAVDLGGRTDLVDLAAILSLCDLVVSNDTGPMHLAGAVGTATVSLWGSSDPSEVRQTGSDDIAVTGPELPCKPCYRNDCHRRGPGTLLADAHEECMRLIDLGEVIAACEAALERRRASE